MGRRFLTLPGFSTLALAAGLALVAALAAAVPAFAEKRVALVIGIGAYQHNTVLANPVNDARDIGAALDKLGFETIVETDLDKNRLADALGRFARRAREAEVALFYYAGHAIQFGGTNYLQPVDARLRDEADLRYQFVRVDDVMADLAQAKNVRIVILDACRDNPLAERLRAALPPSRSAAVGRGLARLERADGFVTAFATQAGSVAADAASRGARNSPFTTALLKHLPTPGLEVVNLFRRVAIEVRTLTKGDQFPELSFSLYEEFYLAGLPETGQRPPTAPSHTTSGPATPEPPPSATRGDPCTHAADHWRSAESIGSREVYEDHLRLFPNCAFARLAQARIAELKKVQVAAPAPPKPLPVPAPVEPAVGLPPEAQAGVFPLAPVRERGLKPKETFKECDACPEMVVLGAGSFVMGSPDRLQGADRNEGPMHPVAINRPFAVGKFEVTRDEFAAFVRETRHDTGPSCWVVNAGNGSAADMAGRSWNSPGFPQTGSHPATCLNWADAKAYVVWLSRKTGKPYRLLSETEWEYAARAGSASAYHFGDAASRLCAFGNGADQAARRGLAFMKSWPVAACNDRHAFTAPVGSYAANGFGLHDMHGNAREWVEDCWNASYTGAPADGSAWLSGNCGRRILRGGSWLNGPGELRAGARLHFDPKIRNDHNGFRVARSLAP